MDPYPYAAPDRMVHMRLITPKGELNGFGTTMAQWQIIRKSPVVEDAFLENDWNLTVTGSDLPEDVDAVYFSSNSFNFLGVPPALGRGLVPSDAIDGQDPQPVVVLGYKFWQRHFHSDPTVLGKTIQMVRKNYTIVGVAGSRFAWGDGDVYLPQKITQDPTLGFYVGLRLKPGVSHAAADAALQPLITQFVKETPKHFPPGDNKLHVVGLNEDFIKQLGGTLYLLFGAVALLLAIGCGNVSILQLARATARGQEFAIRAAVGASRKRIVHQLLTESLLLSLTGAAIGLVLAYRLVAIIVKNLPQYSFPHRSRHPHQRARAHLLHRCRHRHWNPLRPVARPAAVPPPEVSQVMQMQTPARPPAASARGASTMRSLPGRSPSPCSCSPERAQPSKASFAWCTPRSATIPTM